MESIDAIIEADEFW